MFDTTRYRWVAALALAMAVVALSGCGGSGSAASSPLSTAELDFLLGEGSHQSQEYLFYAEQELNKRCMNARGFEYHIPNLRPSEIAEFGGGPKNAESVLTATGKGPDEALELAKRRSVGYGLYKEFTSAKTPGYNPQQAGQEYYRSLSAARKQEFQDAMNGNQSQSAEAHPAGGGPAYTFDNSKSGCLVQGQDQLYGSAALAQSVSQTPQSIRQHLVIATQTDPKVEAKVAAWSRCVQSATGLSFANPEVIEGYLQKRYEKEGVTPAVIELERRVAVKDAECSFSTGMVQTYAATFLRRADAMPESLRGELIALMEHERSAFARAKAILGSHAPQ